MTIATSNEAIAPLGPEWVGALLVPNASIDRHGPGGAIVGGRPTEGDGGSMGEKQGRVRGRMHC